MQASTGAATAFVAFTVTAGGFARFAGLARFGKSSIDDCVWIATVRLLSVFNGVIVVSSFVRLDVNFFDIEVESGGGKRTHR